MGNQVTLNSSYMGNTPRFSYIGIEPLINSNSFAYVSLDADRKLLAIGEGSLTDVFSYLIGQEALVVAIHGPGWMGRSIEGFDFAGDEAPPAVRSLRACELAAWRESIPVEFTPSKAGKFSPACRRGYQLIQMLLRYQFLFAHQTPANKILIETQPAACYHQLVDIAPLSDDTFLGRIQRQLILHDHNLPVQDPMIFFEEITRYKLMMGKVSLQSFLVPQELNAMVMAYTSWLFHQQPAQTRRYGDDADGMLIFPAVNQSRRVHE